MKMTNAIVFEFRWFILSFFQRLNISESWGSG